MLVAFDLNKKAFLVFMVFPTSKTLIYLAREVQIAMLKLAKAFTSVLIEYSEHADVLAAMFF